MHKVLGLISSTGMIQSNPCQLKEQTEKQNVNSINAKLNLVCHLLVLLGAHHILHVSRIRVNVGNTTAVKRTGGE